MPRKMTSKQTKTRRWRRISSRCRNARRCVEIEHFFWRSVFTLTVSANDTVVFLSFRSREVDFRKNSEMTIGNQAVRNAEKCEAKCRSTDVFLYLVLCQGGHQPDVYTDKHSFNLSDFGHRKCLFSKLWKTASRVLVTGKMGCWQQMHNCDCVTCIFWFPTNLTVDIKYISVGNCKHCPCLIIF